MALLAQGDGMILFTSDDANEKLLADIRMAREQGKKIVVIDTDIGEAYYDAFVGIDNEKQDISSEHIWQNTARREKRFWRSMSRHPARLKKESRLFEAVKEAGMETAVSMVSLEEDSEERLMVYGGRLIAQKKQDGWYRLTLPVRFRQQNSFADGTCGGNFSDWVRRI